MRQTTCRQTSLPLASQPWYQGTDIPVPEDIKAFSWHPFQFGRRQAVSACSGSPPQCSIFSSVWEHAMSDLLWSEPHTSGTALHTCVCMFACLLAAIYRKFLMSAVKFQYYEHRAIVRMQCPCCMLLQIMERQAARWQYKFRSQWLSGRASDKGHARNLAQDSSVKA